MLTRSRYSESKKAHAAMLIFAFLVSTSFTVGRAITFTLDPVALTFARFILALIIFLVVVALSTEKFSWPGPVDWMGYFFLAFLLVVFFVSMFEGLRWTTPLSAGAVFTLVPIITALVGWLMLQQKMSKRAIVMLFAASFGSIWIMFGGNLNALISLKLGRGELIFLIGCIAYAGYAPSVKKIHKQGGIVYLTLWTLVAGSVLLFAYGWRSIITTNWHLVSPLVYLGLGWLALFTTVITFYLIQYAALRLPSVKVMSYTLLIPAFVLLQNLVNGGTLPNLSTSIALVLLAVSMLGLQRA